MPPHEAITAKGAWYSNVTEIRLFNDGIIAAARLPGSSERIELEDIARLKLERGPLRNGLKVTLNSGKTIELGGLQKAESEMIKTVAERRILDLRTLEEKQRKATASKIAKKLAPQIIKVDKETSEILSKDRYIRHSQAEIAAKAAAAILQQVDAQTRAELPKNASAAIRRIEALANPDELERIRREKNHRHAAREAARAKESSADLNTHPITDEQADAVVTDEDATLVLAGAGTGKTAVITAKIAHLVRNQGVPPENILALAFNRKAALEIRERLPEDLKGARVSTFHSFALRVVASQGTAPTVSKLAQDDFTYRKAIDAILGRMAAEPEKAKLIIQMVSGFSIEYRAPFDFTTAREYERYVKDAELRTLNGEPVKSFEELTLANYLAAQGVRYTYEKPYEFPTATQEYRQYHPDFHLPDYDVYIEHFALNEQGLAPPGWTRYAEEAEWKRRTHADHKTKLIETFSWQYRKGTLEATLEKQLLENGVQFHPVPPDVLVKKLSRERISQLSGLIGTFLNHAKSGDLEHEEIAAKAQDQRDKDRTECFLKIFADVRHGYEEMLTEENTVDFHDLINRAAAIIEGGQWDNPFDYVLIDEFQDISNGRMNLARALKKPGLAYFLVGDDWQSIYRFAGSHVGLIHQTGESLGFTERKTLTTTFRFGDGILKPSTWFVQQNPEQSKRQLVANSQEENHGITVIPTDLPETGLHQALREIEEISKDPRESVKVLGRYRASRRALGDTRGKRRSLQFSTVHSTKGQEADYVVILDLKDDQYGFPCTIEDDPLLTIVMPQVHGDPYPSAEERRLFYVALTRARKAVYLIADPVRTSPFARELVNNCPDVKVKEGLRPPCPECQRGALVPSQSRENLRCSNFPRCEHRAPRCPGCRRGYISWTEGTPECSNPVCSTPPRTCPRCQEGILVLRTGTSRFWACTRYQSTPSCTYTESAAADSDICRPTNGSAPQRRRRRPRYPANP